MKNMQPILSYLVLPAGGVIQKESRFKMEKGFEAIPTAEGWQLSNAPILSMAAHKASLDIFDEAGMEKLHVKRKMLSDYLLFTLDDINSKQNKKNNFR
jgi:kynureninase